MRKPTQVDVARLAGVSRATVSYVINGKDTQGVPISEETRQRVWDAVHKLNYVINAGAQALRSGDTKTIGVMLPIYENPYFWGMLNGISREAIEAGYKVLLANGELDVEKANQTISELAEQRVDGLILCIEFRSLPPAIREQLRNSTHPIVELTSIVSEFDFVHLDYGDATKALMTHLFQLGHRRIDFLYGVREMNQGLDRFDAYQQAFQDAHLPFDKSWIHHCGQSQEDGYQATLALLQQPERPTALVVINDLLAIAAIRAAADLGLKVPDDLSVASFDDIPFASYFVPRLTTASSDPEQGGRDAVRLLIKRLQEPEREREAILATWQLHIRESTGPVPV